MARERAPVVLSRMNLLRGRPALTASGVLDDSTAVRDAARVDGASGVIGSRCLGCALAALLALWWLGPAAPAHAQDRRLPSAVRVARPGCAPHLADGGLDWDAVVDVLRAELRAMGSDLADGAVTAEARLTLDASCAREASEVQVTLTDLETGSGIIERFELGAPDAPDRARVLALGLSEMVRVRWASLVRVAAPPPVAEPRLDAEDVARLVHEEVDRAVRPMVDSAVDTAVDDAVRARVPDAPPPPLYVDVALGVGSYPAASNATGELRVAVSIPVGIVRLALEAVGAAGWAPDELGDVVLIGAGGALSLRLRHEEASFGIEAGPRVDVGWTHAEGLPGGSGVSGGGLDAPHLAIGLDARVRVPLEPALHLVLGAELAAAVVGLDALSEDTRVTAQIGPRIGVMAGLSWAGATP